MRRFVIRWLPPAVAGVLVVLPLRDSGFPRREPGACRVEGWLEPDGEERVWVLSNPTYVR